jgi:hypothetical protein
VLDALRIGRFTPRARAAAGQIESAADAMNAKEWLAAYSEKLGIYAPTTEEFRILLDLAGEAAHSSERVAAPISCWLAAKAGVDPQTALELARGIDG